MDVKLLSHSSMIEIVNSIPLISYFSISHPFHFDSFYNIHLKVLLIFEMRILSKIIYFRNVPPSTHDHVCTSMFLPLPTLLPFVNILFYFVKEF